MADDPKGESPSLRSLPPMSETADMAWDDDTAPRFQLDDPSFDRITQIPEQPPEMFAKQMMRAVEGSITPGAAPDHDPVSGTFERQSDVPDAGPKAPPPGQEAAQSARLGLERPPALPNSGAPTLPGSALAMAAALAGPTAPPKERRREPSEEPVFHVDSDEPTLPGGPGASARPVKRARSEEPPGSLDLDLSGLSNSAPAPPPSDPGIRELKDRYAMGDYSGALVVAEGILEADPGHAEALRFAKSCRDVLTQMYVARLGSLDQVVSIGIPSDQIRWLSLDHRAGFLLSLVDGTSTIEEILDISGMPRLDALRIMFSLLEERVISLSPRER